MSEWTIRISTKSQKISASTCASSAKLTKPRSQPQRPNRECMKNAQK